MNITEPEIQKAINNLSNVIRAENIEKSSYLELYAGIEILNSVNNIKNQIIYGRRGTGKTHLLCALKELLIESFYTEKRLPIYIDIRKILPLVSLGLDDKVLYAILIFQYLIKEIIDCLIENLQFIYNINPFEGNKIFEKFKEKELRTILNNLNLEYDGKKISKIGELELSEEEIRSIASNLNLSLTPELSGAISKSIKSNSKTRYVKYISFSDISQYLSLIPEKLRGIRIFCLLDEWSEIPLDVQPYLADLLKRGFIPSKFTFKIAGITNRTYLSQRTSYRVLGFEDGGDIFAYNLDNRYIFEINKVQTRDFYNELLYKHVSIFSNVVKTHFFDKERNKADKNFINNFFTNHSLSEILIASAGIPRDFMNLFINSYDKFLLNVSSNSTRITVNHVRLATIDWYQIDKKNEIEKDANTKILLEKIVNEIIIQKKRTHFIIPEKFSSNRYLQNLIDLRALHLRKRGISHQDIKGVNYNVYSIDYGCYTSLNIYQSSLDSQLLYQISTIEDFREIRRVSLEDEFFNKFILEIGEAFNCPYCGKTVDTNHTAYIKKKLCNNCYEEIIH